MIDSTMFDSTMSRRRGQKRRQNPMVVSLNTSSLLNAARRSFSRSRSAQKSERGNLRSSSVASSHSVRSKKKQRPQLRGGSNHFQEGWAVYRPIPAIKLDPIKTAKNTGLKPIKIKKKKTKRRVIMDASN